MIRIFKIGGNVINNPAALTEFLNDFASVSGKKILVHGGGKEATELSRSMGLETKMVNGRRVTDEKTLDIVTMVYAGLINKRIVAKLQELGCNSIGLSGADGNVIPAVRRNPEPMDFGFVGDIDPAEINTRFISLLLDNEISPVFCAICRNKAGGLLNCNADTIAASLAEACARLEPVDLTYCFEKNGVLAEIENEDSVIELITPELFKDYVAEGKISGGMIPKVENALNAISKGVASVRICSSENINSKSGTYIRANAE